MVVDHSLNFGFFETCPNEICPKIKHGFELKWKIIQIIAFILIEMIITMDCGEVKQTM